MTNVFFVTERCPLSLSLAGFLINKGEKCIELLQDRTWIIPSKDAKSLCHATANVLDIINNTQASRMFVHGGSKNVESIILAAALSEKEVFVLDPVELIMISQNLLLGNIHNISTSEQTKQNYLKSESIKNLNDEPTFDIQIKNLPNFPPEQNWFYDYNFYSVIPSSAYAHDNYSLPNYVEEGAAVSLHQRLKAIQICEFFKNEANSSWFDFEKTLSTNMS